MQVIPKRPIERLKRNLLVLFSVSERKSRHFSYQRLSCEICEVINHVFIMEINMFEIVYIICIKYMQVSWLGTTIHIIERKKIEM
jgi:hypothetical protein